MVVNLENLVNLSSPHSVNLAIKIVKYGLSESFCSLQVKDLVKCVIPADRNGKTWKKVI